MHRLRRRLVPVVAGLGMAAACSFPAEPEHPFSPAEEDFTEYVADLDEDAERRMEEMMRDNQELLEEFGYEDDSLPLTGLGGR